MKQKCFTTSKNMNELCHSCPSYSKKEHCTETMLVSKKNNKEPA